MHCQKLEELGFKFVDRINTAHLKKEVLSHFQRSQEYMEGWEIILTNESRISEVMVDAANIIYNYEGHILAEATKN